jgi:hypothetical protein
MNEVPLVFLGCWSVRPVDRGRWVFAAPFYATCLHDARKVLCTMFTHIASAMPESSDTCAEDEPDDAGWTTEVVVVIEGVHAS